MICGTSLRGLSSSWDAEDENGDDVERLDHSTGRAACLEMCRLISEPDAELPMTRTFLPVESEVALFCQLSRDS